MSPRKQASVAAGKLGSLLLFLGLVAGGFAAGAGGSGPQVLVSVDGRDITASDLEQAVASSPFATQFPSLDEDLQASLRGDLLKRLVNAQLLSLEAHAQGLDRSEDYLRRLADFRRGMLYQRYLQRLSDSIAVPADVERTLDGRYKGDPDALAAARAVYVSSRYKTLKAQALASLRERWNVTVHRERLDAAGPDTVLADGDRLRVRLQDLGATSSGPLPERLNEWLDLELAARAAEAAGVDVRAQVAEYGRQLLARLMLERKEREWIPDEAALRRYYLAHPALGHIPGRRHVGQIVVSSREEAEQLRARILQGESLFRLASRCTIDPYGKQHAGDLGWLPEGSGMPEIEKALSGLPDGQVSPIIQTPKGYHLVMVIDRKPGEQRPFEAIKDRVREAIVLDRLPRYLAEVERRHAVEWRVPVRQTPRKSS
jgi:hypothetical protein